MKMTILVAIFQIISSFTAFADYYVYDASYKLLAVMDKNSVESDGTLWWNSKPCKVVGPTTLCFFVSEKDNNNEHDEIWKEGWRNKDSDENDSDFNKTVTSDGDWIEMAKNPERTGGFVKLELNGTSYVTFKFNDTSHYFGVTVVPEGLYLYGDISIGNDENDKTTYIDWNNHCPDQFRLTEVPGSNESEYSITLDVVHDTYFRLNVNGTAYYPSTADNTGDSKDMDVTGEFMFTDNALNKGTDWGNQGAWSIKDDGKYKITAKYRQDSNDAWSLSVTKLLDTPEALYMYEIVGKRYVGLMTKDEDGQTFRLNGERIMAGTSYYVVTTSYVDLDSSDDMWRDINNAGRLIPANYTDQNTDWSINNEWQMMKSGNNGSFIITNQDRRATVDFVVDWNSGMPRFKAEVKCDEIKYYLSGDLNGWIRDWKGSGDYQAATPLDEMREWEFRKCKDEDKDGWYVFGPVDMRGQFQITTGNFMSRHWGHTASIYNNPEDENDSRNGQPEDAYYTGTVSSTPSLIKGGMDVMLNLHLDHNYYLGAKVYFNPAENKIYVDGTPKDIYVYYYDNENGKADENTEANNVSKLQIINEDENKNNYYVKYDESASFQLVDVPEGDATLEKYGILKVWRLKVPNGLEEAYMADEKKHYFSCRLADAGEDVVPQVINAADIYFVHYVGQEPVVLVNYTLNGNQIESLAYKVSDEDPWPLIGAIKIRFVDKDPSGRWGWIAERGGKISFNPDDAIVWTLDRVLNSNEYQDMTTGMENDGKTHWFGCSATTEAVPSNIRVRESGSTPENVWRSQLKTVPFTDANHYIEVEIDYNTDDPNLPKSRYFCDVRRADAEPAENSEGGNGEVILGIDIDGKNIVRPETSDYKMSGKDLYIAIDHGFETGIDEVIRDNVREDSVPEYLNLQGIRIKNPVKGQVYIEIRGGRSRKILF